MITLTPSNVLPNTYSLNWNAQKLHIFEGLRNIFGQDDVLLTDVTLACDGEYIQAHKLVLSLCSSFFKDLFTKNKADKSNTIVILGNVSSMNLRYLLRFIYQGKVDIPSKDVDSFLQAGNQLKIEGLIGNDTDTGQTHREQSSQQSQSQHQQVHNSDISLAHCSPRTSTTPTIAVTLSSKSVAVSSAKCQSPPTPNKKPRLTEPVVAGRSASSSTSGENADVPPVIVGEPVTLKISSNQTQPPSNEVIDPLDDSQQYDPCDMEGDGEEGIDFNNLKTEPIQVYSGYEEGDQSELMHNESVGEDSYGAHVDDHYGLPHSNPALPVPVVPLPHPAAVSGPSTSSQFLSRPRGNIPGQETARRTKRKRSIIWEYFQRQEDARNKVRCTMCHRVFSLGSNKTTSHIRRHLFNTCEDEDWERGAECGCTLRMLMKLDR